jgi:DUF2891 family protein
MLRAMMPFPELAATDAHAIATMVIASLGREYPNHVSLLLEGDHDLLPPRQLTPAFHGSFDWHSAVHGHWCLVRLLRCLPGASFEAAAGAALDAHLTADRIAREVAFVRPRPGFERPYGLAWVLQLGAELREWDVPGARAWRDALEPLVALAAGRLAGWLPRLQRPVRTGEHGQTAFALGLALDSARIRGDRAFTTLLEARARDFYAADVRAPIDYEPSGHDFLSPALAEADVMRRVLAPEAFSAWLGRFLPGLRGAAAARWLTPVTPSDRSDGKLAHLDGLNLSRAWMLEAVVRALPPGDARTPLLAEAARRHAAAGLAAFPPQDYMGSHWLGSFAVYLLTRRGMA